MSSLNRFQHLSVAFRMKAEPCKRHNLWEKWRYEVLLTFHKAWKTEMAATCGRKLWLRLSNLYMTYKTRNNSDSKKKTLFVMRSLMGSCVTLSASFKRILLRYLPPVRVQVSSQRYALLFIVSCVVDLLMEFWYKFSPWHTGSQNNSIK